MSTYKEYSDDFDAHFEAKQGDNNFYNRDFNYRKVGDEGREWKKHKYIFKKKSPAGYMRYYYEVPSEVKGRNNIVGYYEDTGENEAAMRYGGDDRRELSNKQLLDIDKRKDSIKSVGEYPKDAIEAFEKSLKWGDISYMTDDIKWGLECVTDTLSAYADEFVSNLTGIKNDAKNFIAGLLDR